MPASHHKASVKATAQTRSPADEVTAIPGTARIRRGCPRASRGFDIPDRSIFLPRFPPDAAEKTFAAQGRKDSYFAGTALLTRFNAPRSAYFRCYSRAVNSSQPGVIPRDLYVSSLARKWMAAGALCRDQAGHVLLVDPVYRDTWDVPGGVVEAEESPHAACRREVAEETGLERPLGRVLAVNWVPSKPDYPEGLVVIYDGGVLAPGEISRIKVPAEELDGFAFVPPGEVAARVAPIVGRRIHACLNAVDTGKVAALDNGHPAT